MSDPGFAAPLIAIDSRRITDWDSLHDIFAEAFGFPEFYGRNLDAWIDCMSSLGAPDDAMSSIHVEPGQCLTLRLDHAAEFAERCPEIFRALVDATAFVNWRLLDVGQPPVLALAYDA